MQARHFTDTRALSASPARRALTPWQFWPLLAAALVFLLLSFQPAAAQAKAFKEALAKLVVKDRDIAAFYQARNFDPIWTGNRDQRRRNAFIDALGDAPDHGLPEGRYDAKVVRGSFTGFKSNEQKAVLEFQTSQLFLQYAQDIQSGILEPRRIDENMTLSPPRRDRKLLLESFAASNPAAFLKTLPPDSPDYALLLKEKARMEKIVGRGGWGDKVQARKLTLGDNNGAVQQLRARLSRMGYGNLGNSPSYDQGLARAVQRFQIDLGLSPDGVAGSNTIAAINTTAGERLAQTVIGLERLRWLNKPLGSRYILVNEAAFEAYVIDNGKVSFETRVVVGQPGRWRTPEFERTMTHLIINPSWYVPESIAGGEYLPMLQKDPDSLARQGIEMYDTEGNEVDPTTVDYSGYSKDNFPFSMRQPPSDGNALGVVKFMFPNKHAIYLHDTPAKSLFSRAIRAYSHGCVRVADPQGLAHVLLERQSKDPDGLFQSYVDSGVESQLNLATPVPIYLVYRTVWVDKKGKAQYRADTYDVDGKVLRALSKAGVVLRASS